MNHEGNDSRMGILRILRKGRHCVDEISARVRITPTAVRQHLSILERDALVSREALHEGTGRPRYIYFLTEEAESLFPKKYDLLVEMIIEQIIGAEGEDKFEEICKKAGQNLFAANRHMIEGKDIKERMQATLRVFKELGAEPILEERKNGLILKEYNCPFKAISARYPAVCEICLTFIRFALGSGTAVERGLMEEGACSCIIRE